MYVVSTSPTFYCVPGEVAFVLFIRICSVNVMHGLFATEYAVSLEFARTFFPFFFKPLKNKMSKKRWSNYLLNGNNYTGNSLTFALM